MKSDTERKKYYSEKIHKKKNRLHIHLSKDLTNKMLVKKRAILARKGDTVKIMRGPGKGKSGKLTKVSTLKRKVYVEGIAAKTLRGREVPIAIEPSNLLLISLEATKERRVLFSEDIFKKESKKVIEKVSSEEKPQVETTTMQEKPETKIEN